FYIMYNKPQISGNPESGIRNPELVSVFWFRRDLRLDDNTGLREALKAGDPVLPLFIFDTVILKKLSHDDRRVAFIHLQLSEIDKELRKYGSSLLVKVGKPVEVFGQLMQEINIRAVYANRDFESYGVQRDTNVKNLLAANGAGFFGFTDHVIMEPGSVVKADGKPFEVFTPFRNRWMKLFATDGRDRANGSDRAWPVTRFIEYIHTPIPSLEEIGFSTSNISFPKKETDSEKLAAYHETRDFPALDSTSRLGVHLRFGTISIRQLVAKAASLSETFLDELIWREFFIHILAFYPRVVNESFRKQYDNIRWLNDETAFKRWCDGTTGYPLVDAGMRELKATGFMHNRVRMVTASFLVKHLLIDWRWGESWFASLLLDYELASNNGNWQWAAGCGCDAAPYFRIFNPMRQQQRFDPNFIYIKKWVPEFGSKDYPHPMIDHEFARERCIRVYKGALRL
ncbi:MAG TPA: deoxyribodipyrimidine photo-lyase, partial [Lentimicrobium sp.]|nr:deoxyribodipyrimidine photo-lyase [Lentimicrobium sp.]